MSAGEAFMSLAASGGEWVLWALGGLSVGAAAAAVERARLLRAERAALAALRGPLERALEARDWEAARRALSGAPGSAARALGAGLAQAARGREAVLDHLAAAEAEERLFLERRLLWLGTLGNNAPFVGLFGTVLGVIQAFRDLAQSGAGPEVVMAGLSEALVATAAGLLVALPCVAAFNVLQKAVRDFQAQTGALGRRLAAAAAER